MARSSAPIRVRVRRCGRNPSSAVEDFKVRSSQALRILSPASIRRVTSANHAASAVLNGLSSARSVSLADERGEDLDGLHPRTGRRGEDVTPRPHRMHPFEGCGGPWRRKGLHPWTDDGPIGPFVRLRDRPDTLEGRLRVVKPQILHPPLLKRDLCQACVGHRPCDPRLVQAGFQRLDPGKVLQDCAVLQVGCLGRHEDAETSIGFQV